MSSKLHTPWSPWAPWTNLDLDRLKNKPTDPTPHGYSDAHGYTSHNCYVIAENINCQTKKFFLTPAGRMTWRKIQFMLLLEASQLIHTCILRTNSESLWNLYDCSNLHLPFVFLDVTSGVTLSNAETVIRSMLLAV